MTLALRAALLVSLVFAVRFGLAVWHWGTLPVDPQLEGWMTLRFIAHSWDVPPDVVQRALPRRRIDWAGV